MSNLDNANHFRPGWSQNFDCISQLCYMALFFLFTLQRSKGVKGLEKARFLSFPKHPWEVSAYKQAVG